MATTWTVNALDFYKSHEGKTNVVFTVHWNCADKDTDETQDSAMVLLLFQQMICLHLPLIQILQKHKQ